MEMVKVDEIFICGTEKSDQVCKKHGINKIHYKKPGKHLCSECEKEQDKKDDEARERKEAERNKADRIRICTRSLCFPPKMQRMTIDSFSIDNEGEASAVSLAKKFMASYPNVGCLTLAGNMGTGKTHIAAGICQIMAANGHLCHYTTIMRMIREIRSSWKGGKETEQQAIDRFSRNYDILVIDEIGLQYKKDLSIKLQLAEVIDGRILWEKPTILVGNVKNEEEAEAALGSRVIDRSADDGMFIMFDWESRRKMKNVGEIDDSLPPAKCQDGPVPSHMASLMMRGVT